MDIRTEKNFIGEWQSVDAGTYDAGEIDEEGFVFSRSPVGTGKTPLNAIVDLLDQIEERAPC